MFVAQSITDLRSMAELVIPIREYIGESQFNWETLEMEWATNADDLRMAVEYAEYSGMEVTSICLEMGRCYGGSTFHGTEMYNYLQGLGIKVRTRILSLAASMATIVMLVGEVEMDATAQLMIHAPSMDAGGTAAQIRASLALLDNTHESLRELYIARTGQTAEVVDEWMSKDTYIKASDAKILGLCSRVIPIAPANASQPTEAQASATRAKVSGIVARAEKRAISARKVPSPKAKAATATPLPRTMATKKATPAAAAKKATPAALSATQKQNIKIVADLAKQLGVKATIEGATEEIEVVAVVEPTVLADGAGTLYTDGVLVVDSAVFNDEALTVATADGIYETEDGRDITVAGGIVTGIEDTPATAEAEATGTTAILAEIRAMRAERAADSETIKTLRADLDRFKVTVPPAPTPKARAASGSQITPKDGTPTPTAKRGVLAGASSTK